MSDDTPAEQPERTGSVSYQDPSTTVPREPTLAEQRAREHAAREQEASEAAWWDEQAKRAKRRKRILVGGAVGVGLVAVMALAYSSSHPSSTQERCVGPDNVVVDASNCMRPAANTSSYGGYGGGGFFPIFIGNGGRQYHYTYGGSGGIGQMESGGTTVPPRTATVRTTSGSSSGSGSFGSGSSSESGSSSGSSTVTRGGFGVRSHGRSRGR